MKIKKIISGLLACALIITQFSGTTTFASVNSGPTEPHSAISAPADNADKTLSDKESTPAETNGEKTSDAANTVISFFAAIPDSVTAIPEGQAGYESYLEATKAMAALDALSAEDKAIATAAIGDKLAYVASLVSHTPSVAGEEKEPATDHRAALSLEQPETPIAAATSGKVTTGESVTDYERLGGVTVNFGGTVGEYSIVLEANEVGRTYGDDYSPNGITMMVKGLTADEQKSFDYKTVFNNPVTADDLTDLIPMTITVTDGTAQNGETDAGVYSVGVGCGTNAVTYAGHSFPISTTNTGKINVARREITIVAEDASKTYGQSDPKFDYVVKSGTIVNGDELLPEMGGLYRIHGTDTENVGSYEIMSKLEHKNYKITFEKAGHLSITKAHLIITGGFTDEFGTFKQTHTREYGNKDLPFGFTATGLKYGDNLADFGTISVDFKATSTSAPGDYYVTPSGINGTLKNYDVTYTNGTLHVAPRSIKITVDDASKEYGDIDPKLTHEILAPNASDPKKYDTAWDGKALVTLKGDVTRTAGEDVGSYPIINGYTAENNKNYEITFNAKDFVIEQANLTISVKDYSRFYGELNPEFEVTYNGFENGETANSNSLTGTLVFECPADKTSDVGTYAIKASGYDANKNYKIKYVAGALAVNARPITVSLPELNSVYGDTVKSLTYEFSCTIGDAIVNNDTISGGITTDPATIKDVGEYKIISTFAHKNYVFTVKEGTYNVTARPLTVTIDNKTAIYGDAQKELTYKLSKDSLVEGDTFTGKVGFNPDIEVRNVGKYDIICTFETSMSNYTIDVIDGEYEIIPATIKVTMPDTSKLYGTKTIVPELNFEGFKYDDGKFVNIMAVALFSRDASILPNVTVEIDDEVSDIKGYVADVANTPTVYTDAFKFIGETFGNYKYEMASGNLSVSRLEALNNMYSVNGSKKDTNTYNSNVSIKAANGYKLSYSDVLEGNSWADSIQVVGDATHNVKFYIVRLSDGSITNSSIEKIKIDTYVAPDEPTQKPTYRVVNNPRTGADFFFQNIWLIVILGILFTSLTIYVVKKKKDTTKK